MAPFPSLGGVARSAGVVFLSVCRKVADHPVSRFATATPPKEGNLQSEVRRHRVGAVTVVAVQSVDGVHLGWRQLEIEDRAVLLDARPRH